MIGPVTPPPTVRRRRARRKRLGDLPVALLLLTLLGVLLGPCRRRVLPLTKPEGAAPSKISRFLKGVVVVVDPGHGGADSGANRGGMSEAQLTYRMATTLAASLQQAGAEVIFSVHSTTLTYFPKEGEPEPPLEAPRDARFALDNKYVGARRQESPEDLYRRAGLAAQVWRSQAGRRPVLFLSLHYDALGESRWRGGLICYDARLRQPPRLASELARRWASSGLGGQRRAGAPKPRELGVLNPAHNPVPQSVLIELATISSPRDLSQARSPAWRWKVARLIREAIAATLKNTSSR
jgi:N-acetylmuramoyl-L-alanine amidase